jgi:hypothetical protein
MVPTNIAKESIDGIRGKACCGDYGMPVIAVADLRVAIAVAIV